MPLIENDTFTRPLYHGTTSLFIDSIMENGLGEMNPLVELGAYDTFQELFELGEKSLKKDDFWNKSRKKLLPFVHQEYLGGNLNFRHGESYLTLIRECAVQYAEQCCVGGCEYLNYLHTLIRMLSYKNVVGVESVVSPQLIEILTTEHKPVLITLNNVPISSVETETGNCIDAQIAQIDNFYSEEIDINLAFKLVAPCERQYFEVQFISA